MPIYNRDNINYGSMLENAIRNRLQYIKDKADNTRKQGELWGNFVTNTGSRLFDAGFAAADSDSPEARLEALKKELAEASLRENAINNAAYDMQDYTPNVEQIKAQNAVKNYSDYLAKASLRENAINNAANDMQGYVPQRRGYVPAIDQERADQEAKNREHFADYLAYVNGITGNGVYGMEDFYRRGR